MTKIIRTVFITKIPTFVWQRIYSRKKSLHRLPYYIRMYLLIHLFSFAFSLFIFYTIFEYVGFYDILTLSRLFWVSRTLRCPPRKAIRRMNMTVSSVGGFGADPDFSRRFFSFPFSRVNLVRSDSSFLSTRATTDQE